jgi:hypothetical protein
MDWKPENSTKPIRAGFRYAFSGAGTFARDLRQPIIHLNLMPSRVDRQLLVSTA